MSNTTIAETKPRVHLSLFKLRDMWIELADQIEAEPDAPEAAERITQLDALEAEIMAAPVEAGEDWAALADLALRDGSTSGLGVNTRLADHLGAVAVRVLDQSRRRDRVDHARTQFLLERGMSRLRDQFGQASVRFVVEAESAAEVLAVLRGAMASRIA